LLQRRLVLALNPEAAAEIVVSFVSIGRFLLVEKVTFEGLDYRAHSSKQLQFIHS